MKRVVFHPRHLARQVRHTRTHTHMHACMYTCMHTHVHIRTGAYLHVNLHTYIHIFTYMHIHLRAYTHTHTHTHPPTHTHTHIRAPGLCAMMQEPEGIEQEPLRQFIATIQGHPVRQHLCRSLFLAVGFFAVIHRSLCRPLLPSKGVCVDAHN